MSEPVFPKFLSLFLFGDSGDEPGENNDENNYK